MFSLLHWHIPNLSSAVTENKYNRGCNEHERGGLHFFFLFYHGSQNAFEGETKSRQIKHTLKSNNKYKFQVQITQNDRKQKYNFNVVLFFLNKRVTTFLFMISGSLYSAMVHHDWLM